MPPDAHATTQTVLLTGSGERTVSGGFGLQTKPLEAGSSADGSSETGPSVTSRSDAGRFQPGQSDSASEAAGSSQARAEQGRSRTAASGPATPRLGRDGMCISNYRLDALMGEGAMGSVWKATNLNLGKEVAVKLVKLAEADPAAHERLRNEACLAAKINHSNVVTVFDTGVTEEGCYYLVMELLEGQDLSRFLEARGKLPAIEAVRILLPVLCGLDCAHKKKILHRDIKPENIFLAQSDERVVPKLVDFGIALAGDLPQSLRSTRVGSLLGTPLYMSPEQARGDLALDERTDIWAIATVLYELIAGAPPFAADTLQALFFGIACHPMPALDPTLCDTELSEILSRGLAKDPSARWSSAREMGAALASWLGRNGVTQDISAHAVDAIWLSGSVPARAPEHAPSSGFSETAPFTNGTVSWGSSPFVRNDTPPLVGESSRVEPLGATHKSSPAPRERPRRQGVAALRELPLRRWVAAAFPLVAGLAYLAQGGEPDAVEAQAAIAVEARGLSADDDAEGRAESDVTFPLVWRAPRSLAVDHGTVQGTVNAKDPSIEGQRLAAPKNASAVDASKLKPEAPTEAKVDPNWGF